MDSILYRSSRAVPKDLDRTTVLRLRHVATSGRRGVLRRERELEPEVGTVVRLGRKANTSVPHHEFLSASLLPQERKARGEIEFAPAENDALKAT